MAGANAIDEAFALAYWQERRLPVTIVRFFNTVGPRQTGRYGMVVPRLVRQALRNEQLTVFGLLRIHGGKRLSRDERPDVPVEMTPAGQPHLEPIEAVLPLLHVQVRAESVLKKQELSARL